MAVIPFALLGIEHRITFEKRNFPLGLLAIVAGFGAGNAVGIDDKLAVLALAHIAAELKRLFESEPERVSSISLFDGLPITAIDGLPTSASRLL